MKIPLKSRARKATGYLDGQLLMAMPVMSDKRFARSVIFLCSHSEEGAMGLIINQRAPNIAFSDLLQKIGIARADDDEVANELLAMNVHIGGPVDTGRGFVLHSDDYRVADATLPISDGICLTATVDVLKSIALGKGPERAMLALGYAGWAPGQLESEFHANGWLSCPADAGILFEGELETKYARALAKIGVDPSHLVAEAGHA